MTAFDLYALRAAAARGDADRTRSLARDDAESRAAVARSEGRTVPAEPDPDAAVHLAHASFVALDVGAARASLSILQQAPNVTTESPSFILGTSFARLLLNEPFRADFERFSDPRDRLDASLIRQLRADASAAEDALPLARRLTRMARTEGDTDALVIAGVQLARQRRLAGFPHLARRILSQVSQVHRSRWDAWIAWERAMTGVEIASPAADAIDSAAWASVARLRAALADASHLEATPPAWSPWARDWARLRAVLASSGDTHPGDPSATDADARAMDAWRTGETHRVPFGLAALSSVPVEEPPARVVAAPGAPGWRTIRRGPSPFVELTLGSMRTQTAIAELALRGPDGQPTETFFRQVYGFGYVPSRHRASLDVLLHRVRAELPEGATLWRADDRLGLAHGGVAVPDPRTVTGPEESVLAAIAERSAASARDLADALDMPLRSVQRILRALSVDGVCQVRGRGPATEYHVEDTTFADPTNLGER